MTTTLVQPPCVHRGDDGMGILAWRPRAPVLAIASAPYGGGIGTRPWVLNAQVAGGFSATDLVAHVEARAAVLGLAPGGTAFLTAVDVAFYEHAIDAGTTACATVGLSHPTFAAADDHADDGAEGSGIGTINIVASVPRRLGDAALVNAVATVTEAKCQALAELGVPATGTASDATCVLCPVDADAQPFAGPRSAMGAPLARAVHRAVRAGAVAWLGRSR